MLPFTKWPHIENLQNEIDKNSYLYNRAKELDVPWCVTEKIDGTNIGLTISKNDYQLNTRNNIIESQDFFNIHNTKYLLEPVIKPIQGFIKNFQKFTNPCSTITLFGEYYGTNVMNRINYKVPYDFKFYAMGESINNDFIYFSQRCFRNLMASKYLYKFTVPLLYIGTFEECINYANNEYSRLNNEETMEGVVITPWNVAPYVNKDKYIFKNKNEKFLERTTNKVEYKNINMDICEELHSVFLEYVNESRMYSVISKIGKPTSNKDFGKYASIFINDAYEDFCNDLPQDKKYILLDKNAVKFIKNVGSKPYNIFCKIINDYCHTCKYYNPIKDCLEDFLDYSHCLYDGPIS